MNQVLPRYSNLEDRLNVASHGLGLLLSLIGLVLMLSRAVAQESGWSVVSALIYGVALIALFGSSSLYHAIQQPRWRQLMQRFDHIAILYLIAGTFTPFALVSLHSPAGWILFGFIWSCAILGTLIHLTSLRRFHKAMVALNLLMGWSTMLIIVPLSSILPAVAIGMLVAGGITYTLGLVFYFNSRLFLNHFIWHLFVLIGAGLHFCTVLFFVL